MPENPLLTDAVSKTKRGQACLRVCCLAVFLIPALPVRLNALRWASQRQLAALKPLADPSFSLGSGPAPPAVQRRHAASRKSKRRRRARLQPWPAMRSTLMLGPPFCLARVLRKKCVHSHFASCDSCCRLFCSVALPQANHTYPAYRRRSQRRGVRSPAPLEQRLPCFG